VGQPRGTRLQVCQDAGARLCTVAELLNEVTRGTGCQHDAEVLSRYPGTEFTGLAQIWGKLHL
jgi:hypothetical protein